MMMMDRTFRTHGEKRNAHRILVGEPERNRPLEARRRWMDNIKWILEKYDG
jgi:hypothetical protein